MDVQMLTQYFLRYGAVFIFVIILLEYMNLPGFPARDYYAACRHMGSQRTDQFFHGNGPWPGGRTSGKLDFIWNRTDGRGLVSGPLSETLSQT